MCWTSSHAAVTDAGARLHKHMALRTALFGLLLLLLAHAVLADVVRVTSWAEFEAATRPLAFERDTAVSIELAANITLAPAPTPLAQRGIEVARGNNVTEVPVGGKN